MFTNQAQIIAQLRKYLPEEAVNLLSQAFANCAQPLTHRAPVTLEGWPDRAKGRAAEAAPEFAATIDPDDMFAMLKVLNAAGEWDNANVRVKKGAAAVFQGPVIMKANAAGGIALVVVGGDGAGGIRADNLYVGNIYNTSGGSFNGAKDYAGLWITTGTPSSGTTVGFLNNFPSNISTSDAANDRITVGATGDYMVWGQLSCVGGAGGGTIAINLEKNGTPDYPTGIQYCPDGEIGSASFCQIVSCTAGDHLKLYHTFTGNISSFSDGQLVVFR